MHKIVILLFILFNVIPFFGQSSDQAGSLIGRDYIITAKSGLRVRSSPDTKASVITTLYYLYKVTVIRSSHEHVTVDGITSNWHEIEFMSKGSKSRGWAFGGYLQPADDLKSIKLPYHVHFTMHHAAACCQKACERWVASRVQQCADISMKMCDECDDEYCSKLIAKKSPQRVIDCCVNKKFGRDQCGEACEGGGSSSCLGYGWTPTVREWIEDSTLQYMIERKQGPNFFKPAAVPEICK